MFLRLVLWNMWIELELLFISNFTKFCVFLLSIIRSLLKSVLFGCFLYQISNDFVNLMSDANYHSFLFYKKHFRDGVFNGYSVILCELHMNLSCLILVSGFDVFINGISGLCSYYDQSGGLGTENVEGEQKQV